MHETTNFMNETRTNFRNQDVSIQNSEIQVGKLSKQLLERSQGSLPSKIVTNSKENVKAITLRSGTVLEQPQNEEKLEEHEEKTDEEKVTEPTKEELKKEKALRRKAKKYP